MHALATTTEFHDRTTSNALGAEKTWTIIALWALALATFSIPGRVAPDSADSLDILALIKFMTRLGAFATGTLLLSRYIGSRESRPELKAFGVAVPFLIWATFSVAWSPMKSISLGQLLGLYASVVFTILVAVISRAPENGKRILQHLNYAILTVSAITLVAHLIDPKLAGLDRDLWEKTEGGIVHPTQAGATSSLGIILLLVHRLSGYIRVGHLLFLGGIVVHASVLLAANSRSALGMTVVAAFFTVLLLGSKRLQALLLIGIAFAGPVYVTFDPGFTGIAKSLNKSTEFVSRGQTSAQLAAGSGRGELWDVMWEEYVTSPLLGHGYFITASKGYMYVWGETQMLDAHNVWFQVLSTTGAIGFLLFLFGGWQLTRSIVALHSGTSHQRFMYSLFLVMAIWFFGWGIGCSTFMSAIRPESIVFFAILGASVGAVYPQATPLPSVTPRLRRRAPK